MAETPIVFNAKNVLADTIEDFYTSPEKGSGTVILSFTASNNTTSSVTYKGYIYSSQGALVNAIIPQKIVVRDRFDLGASIIGQIIPAGGSLRMESSEAASIGFYVTGDAKA
jgi:hypothetical protein